MINGKKYIGQKKFYKGWHRYLGSGTYLKSAFDKYGKHNFNLEIIHIAYSFEELNHLEIEYIRLHNAVSDTSYYNLAIGGLGGHPPNGLKGKDNPLYGRKNSPEHRAKISKALKGKYVGEKHWCYGKKFNDGINSPFAKKVICLTTGKIFDYINLAAKANDISNSAISACCKGIQSTAGKHPETGERLRWQYYEDYISSKPLPPLSTYHVGSGSLNPHAKKIICLNTKEVFRCIMDASNKYKTSIQNLSCAISGRQHSAGKHPETGEKLRWMYYSDYEQGKQFSFIDKSHHKAKKVICLTTNKVFDSISIATDYYDIQPSGIGCNCSGKQQSAGKHPETGEPLRWMYYEDYLKEIGENN